MSDPTESWKPLAPGQASTAGMRPGEGVSSLLEGSAWEFPYPASTAGVRDPL